MSADGRYLWFYAAFPPNRKRVLAVADLFRNEVRLFPETGFGEGDPYVEPETGAVYWMEGCVLWRGGPGSDASVEAVNSLPEELVKNKTVSRSVTHLTRSADGREFFVDFCIGLGYYFGSLTLNGEPWRFWWRFDRNYNHAQFSPTEPDLVLFAEEHHHDPITGLTFPIVNRMWRIRRGEAPMPAFSKPTRVSHEWWDADGAHVWCVWGNETWRVRLADETVEKIAFPRPCWHSHSSRNGQWIVGDSTARFYRGCPSTVHFLNRETGREIVLADNPERANDVGRNYHNDPHPRFCSGDRYVVFTTTVRGEVDVAVALTTELVALTF